jgi:2-keto-4-pentenoate hydratase/2-oxohepta-3-ene-1,7-dioic acid hydratase in catechol pathway
LGQADAPDAPDVRLVDLSRAAALAGDGHSAAPATLRDMLALIAGGPSALAQVARLAAAAPAEATLALAEVELLAPIPRPRKNVFCVGRNYAEHAVESRRAAGEATPAGPARVNIFTKPPTTVNSPYGEIPLDASVTQEMDWEVELGVIIGASARQVSHEQALAHVWGYTVANDITARDLQHLPGIQWFLGKSMDGSCPLGPWIVTADEIPDPQALRLSLSVNGVVKQDDTTANMIFDVASIIETLSHVLTLEPGDIIITGTPAGVGFARTPKEFLHPGDVVEASVERIGALRNRVVAV